LAKPEDYYELATRNYGRVKWPQSTKAWRWIEALAKEFPRWVRALAPPNLFTAGLLSTGRAEAANAATLRLRSLNAGSTFEDTFKQSKEIMDSQIKGSANQIAPFEAAVQHKTAAFNNFPFIFRKLLNQVRPVSQFQPVFGRRVTDELIKCWNKASEVLMTVSAHVVTPTWHGWRVKTSSQMTAAAVWHVHSEMVRVTTAKNKFADINFPTKCDCPTFRLQGKD